MFVQCPGVQGPPRTVPFALDPVQHQVVNVQLRVPVAARVLREAADNELVGVFPPAGGDAVDLAAVVAGAGVAGFALEVVQGGLVA